MQPLRIWVGPTSSEKSTRALRAARRLERHMTVRLVRPFRSIRRHEHLDFLTTKGGESYPAKNAHKATAIWPLVESAGAVWIDEPMLFDEEQEVFAVIQHLRQTKPILVSGLSATSELGVFGDAMPKLLAVADEVEWCRADCDGCGLLYAATRSFYKPGQKEQEVAVGGEESYSALCPSCWTKATLARQQEAAAV